MSDIDLSSYEKLRPTVEKQLGGKTFSFSAPDSRVYRKVCGMDSEGSEILRWILSLSTEDVLVESGAEIGLAAIPAAALRSVQVYAFEADAQNFAILTRNVIANAVYHHVLATCAALDFSFSMQRMAVEYPYGGGATKHGLARDFPGGTELPKGILSQGRFGLALDSLVAAGFVRPPTALKLSHWHEAPDVLAGATGVLSSAGLRTIMAEIQTNAPRSRQVAQRLACHGFLPVAEQASAGEAVLRDVLFVRR